MAVPCSGFELLCGTVDGLPSCRHRERTRAQARTRGSSSAPRLTMSGKPDEQNIFYDCFDVVPPRVLDVVWEGRIMGD